MASESPNYTFISRDDPEEDTENLSEEFIPQWRTYSYLNLSEELIPISPILASGQINLF